MTTRLSELLDADDRPDWHIAALCGIHPSTLSRYKTGEREIPNKAAVSLATFFDTDVDTIRARVSV